MTLATEIFYSGINPYTGERVFTATRQAEKVAQRKYFFWYDPAARADIKASLDKLQRPDLAKALFAPGARRFERKYQVEKSTNDSKRVSKQPKEHKKRKAKF
jgi:hypothetical protein